MVLTSFRLLSTLASFRLVMETKRKFELLDFGYAAEWEYFRGAVIYRQLFLHVDSSLPRQLFFHPRFTNAECGHVWILIKACINELCGQTPTNIPMGVPAPTTNFVGMSVTLIETQCKTPISAPCQYDKNHVSWRNG
jgi:hypothetical protein